MDGDFSMLIGLISVVSVVGVVGLSYLGAYLVGHSRGRREAELERQIGDRDSHLGDPQRIDAIQHTLSSMAQAIERLTDAQRVALLDRMRVPEPRQTRAPRQDTPA